MISRLPPFVEGTHWRELPHGEGGNRWRFELRHALTLALDVELFESIEFHDKNGRVWAALHGSHFTIQRYYCWNGSSPKRWFPLLGWCGTPDCRGDVTGIGGNILASVLHDALRQFERTEHMPLTTREMDVAFYDVNKLSGFPLALPYYSAVRAASAVWPTGGGGGYSILLDV